MAGEAKQFDLIVIGAGAAGSTIAGEARALGASVALVERWKVGGTCLNAGCDPTKTLVRSAEVLHLARTAGDYGIAVEAARVDWPAVRRRVEHVIDTIRGGDGDANIRATGVDLRKGDARFVGPHEVEVGGDRLRGDRIVVATGARAHVPPIPGLVEAGFATNVEAVAFDALPRSLAILGAGVVATEFAQIFRRFGVEVTVLNRRDRILPREDADLATELEAVLRREGVRIEPSVRAERVERVNGIARIHVAGDGGAPFVVEAETILLATGRVPVVAGLDLDAAGIAHGPDGIVVDRTLRTSLPHVWAAGDVIKGARPFTHVADAQAKVVVHNALGGGPMREFDDRVVPWVVFTDPELARVGPTEAEARAAGLDVAVASYRFRGLDRAITATQTDGLVKLLADRSSGRLVAGHLLGAHAGELLPEVALAVRLGLPASALSDTLHAYPTFAEGVFWAALELAEPHDPLMDAVRGVQVPVE